jgi:hypothetical protein
MVNFVHTAFTNHAPTTTRRTAIQRSVWIMDPRARACRR